MSGLQPWTRTNKWRQILTPKTPIDLTPNRTRMITEIPNMKKETVRLLLAPTGWIWLELLNLFLVQTGMKYPHLTEIGKGAMITTRKASNIAWKSKTVYHLLRSSPTARCPCVWSWKMFGDEIIPSQTFARDFCSAIFINNLHWRWSRESAKTLYGSYENFNGDVPIINVDDILCETIKHVNKEHIGAFYRAAYGKFVTVLKEVELKDLYFHEIKFKGKVGDTDHI